VDVVAGLGKEAFGGTPQCVVKRSKAQKELKKGQWKAVKEKRKSLRKRKPKVAKKGLRHRRGKIKRVSVPGKGKR